MGSVIASIIQCGLSVKIKAVNSSQISGKPKCTTSSTLRRNVYYLSRLISPICKDTVCCLRRLVVLIIVLTKCVYWKGVCCKGVRILRNFRKDPRPYVQRPLPILSSIIWTVDNPVCP